MFPTLKTPNAIYQNRFFLSQQGIDYSREASGFWDLCSNIAGIYELIAGFIGFFVYSIAKNRFVLSSIAEMFLIKTLDPDLMETPKVSIDPKNFNVELKTKVG
jgi:hypothetical protein